MYKNLSKTFIPCFDPKSKLSNNHFYHISSNMPLSTKSRNEAALRQLESMFQQMDVPIQKSTPQPYGSKTRNKNVKVIVEEVVDESCDVHGKKGIYSDKSRERVVQKKQNGERLQVKNKDVKTSSLDRKQPRDFCAKPKVNSKTDPSSKDVCGIFKDETDSKTRIIPIVVEDSPTSDNLPANSTRIIPIVLEDKDESSTSPNSRSSSSFSRRQDVDIFEGSESDYEFEKREVACNYKSEEDYLKDKSRDVNNGSLTRDKRQLGDVVDHGKFNDFAPKDPKKNHVTFKLNQSNGDRKFGSKLGTRMGKRADSMPAINTVPGYRLVFGDLTKISSSAY